MLLAQAHDRCMATYGSRLLESKLDDNTLFIVAKTLCQDIEDKLMASIRTNVAPEDAEEAISALTTNQDQRYAKSLKSMRDFRDKMEAENNAKNN